MYTVATQNPDFFFRPERIAVSRQLRVVESLACFRLLVSLATSRNWNGVPIFSRSRDIRFSWKLQGKFLIFSHRRFSHAQEEVICMKIWIWTQLTPKNQRTNSLCNRSGGKKNASARKKTFYLQQRDLCSKHLSRSNSESEGLRGELQ